MVGALSPGSRAQNAEFRFDRLSLRASLDSLGRIYSLSIVYLDRLVDGEDVSTTCTGCDFAEALDRVLRNTSLTWIRIGNQVVLREQPPRQTEQRATIAGTVLDSATGEWIPGASILLEDTVSGEDSTLRRRCPTNSYGFFSLRNVPRGTYSLVARALGYRSAKATLHVTNDESVFQNIGLVQEEIPLQEITVEGHRTTLAPAERFAHGTYLRSVPSDQNLYLLEGARVYNPAHYGGVLSTFNAEALNDVQVNVGGLSPYYGGVVGGIVDLSMRDGTRSSLSGSAGAGSLGAHVSLEGPLEPSTTFLLSGRKGFPDAVVPFLPADGTPNRLGSSELIAKVTHALSGKDQISLSGYAGRDAYNNVVGNGAAGLGNNFTWGNSMLNLRWIGIASPSLFLHASSVYTRYYFTLEHTLLNNPIVPGRDRFFSRYALEDISIRAHAENYYDEDHTVRAGVELTHHRMSGTISEFSTQTSPLSLPAFASLEASVYLQDQWRILPRVTAELGARATSFTGDGGNFSAVDPRFSLLFTPDEYTRLFGSLTAINQFIHPYRNSGVFLLYPTMFWYPSTEQVPLSTSLQVTLGVEQGLNDNEFLASFESYYRITNHVHEFRIDSAGAPLHDLTSQVLTGTGRAYGIECSIRKRTGALSGSIAYTLSWLRERVAEINGGEAFSPPFDRRHELQIVAWYVPIENWSFGILCVVASDESASSVPGSHLSPSGTNRFTEAPEFVDINGGRLPGFQRIELHARYGCTLWDRPSRLALRFMNAYGLLDPIAWQIHASNDPRSAWGATLHAPDLTPLYPAFALTVWF